MTQNVHVVFEQYSPHLSPGQYRWQQGDQRSLHTPGEGSLINTSDCHPSDATYLVNNHKNLVRTARERQKHVFGSTST